MPDFKEMYFELFNKVTNVINILQAAQTAGEKSFMEDDDEPVSTIFPAEDEKNNGK